MMTLVQKLVAFGVLGLLNVVGIVIGAVAGGLFGLLLPATFLCLSLAAGAAILRL